MLILIIYYKFFPCFNIFTARKIRNNPLEASFNKLSASTEPENYLRIKSIVETEIDFLLEFDRYSSEQVDPVL